MEKLKIIGIIAAITAVLSACTKEMAITNSTAPEYTYSVRLTDATAPINQTNYNKINIDIRNVIVVGKSGRSYTFMSHPGIYNLLKFANGRDTLIAVGVLAEKDIDYIRIILGTNHSVVKNGVTYPLKAMNYQQTSIQVDVEQILKLGLDNTVVIDFDAAQSVQESKGIYRLLPVVRTLNESPANSLTGMQLAQ